MVKVTLKAKYKQGLDPQEYEIYESFERRLQKELDDRQDFINDKLNELMFFGKVTIGKDEVKLPIFNGEETYGR